MSAASIQSAPVAQEIASAADPAWTASECATAIKRIKSAVNSLPIYVLPGANIVLRLGPSSYKSLNMGTRYAKLPVDARASDNILTHLGLDILASPSKLKSSDLVRYMTATGFSKHQLLSSAKVATVAQLTAQDFFTAAPSIPAFLDAIGFASPAPDASAATLSAASRSHASAAPSVAAPAAVSYNPSRSSASSFLSSVSGITTSIFGRPVPEPVAEVHEDTDDDNHSECSGCSDCWTDEDDAVDEDDVDDTHSHVSMPVHAIPAAVYYKSKSGLKYHSKLGCSSSSMPVSADAIAKLSPCKLCIGTRDTSAPSSASRASRSSAPSVPLDHHSTVYCSAKGTKYHTRSGCSKATTEISLSDALARSLQLCDNCRKHSASADGESSASSAPIAFEFVPASSSQSFFCTAKGAKYHIYSGCAGAETPITQDDIAAKHLTLCGNCSKKAQRAAAH